MWISSRIYLTKNGSIRLKKQPKEGLNKTPISAEQLWIQENLEKIGRVYGFGIEWVNLKKSTQVEEHIIRQSCIPTLESKHNSSTRVLLSMQRP